MAFTVVEELAPAGPPPLKASAPMAARGIRAILAEVERSVIGCPSSRRCGRCLGVCLGVRTGPRPGLRVDGNGPVRALLWIVLACGGLSLMGSLGLAMAGEQAIAGWSRESQGWQPQSLPLPGTCLPPCSGMSGAWGEA